MWVKRWICIWKFLDWTIYSSSYTKISFFINCTCSSSESISKWAFSLNRHGGWSWLLIILSVRNINWICLFWVFYLFLVLIGRISSISSWSSNFWIIYFFLSWVDLKCNVFIVEFSTTLWYIFSYINWFLRFRW
jgi:hypothetical protein